ncbi:hypothetical protein Nepgr_018646 [Nepenthes gracilis]|uniref:Uncharacterized protein n=1 Tax=Nepenthes gracilis TaxID=150966 RepID=A0AAD3SRV3_NEPGR|nr:hypothetical protein Nepgr_018646 [Nepenthes gracilis]
MNVISCFPAWVSSSKSSSIKLVQEEADTKSSSVYLGALRSLLPASPSTNFSDEQARMSINGGNSEPSQIAEREEKSSSSCSCENAKNLVPSGKEDT